MAMVKGRWGSPSVTKKRLMAKSGGFVRQVRNGFYYEGRTCVVKKYQGKYPVCCGSLRCGKELPLEKVILCQKKTKKVRK